MLSKLRINRTAYKYLVIWARITARNSPVNPPTTKNFFKKLKPIKIYPKCRSCRHENEKKDFLFSFVHDRNTNVHTIIGTGNVINCCSSWDEYEIFRFIPHIVSLYWHHFQIKYQSIRGIRVGQLLNTAINVSVVIQKKSYWTYIYEP